MVFHNLKTHAVITHKTQAQHRDMLPGYKNIPSWVITRLSERPYNCFVNRDLYNTFKIYQLTEYFGGIENVEITKWGNGYIIQILNKGEEE